MGQLGEITWRIAGRNHGFGARGRYREQRARERERIVRADRHAPRAARLHAPRNGVGVGAQVAERQHLRAVATDGRAAVRFGREHLVQRDHATPARLRAAAMKALRHSHSPAISAPISTYATSPL